MNPAKTSVNTILEVFVACEFSGNTTLILFEEVQQERAT